MTRSLRHATAAMAAAMLAGCSLLTNYERPAPAVPAAFPSGDAYRRATDEAPLPALALHEIFTDPALLRFIEAGLGNNQDLKLAAANVAAVQSQYRIQRAQRTPRIDGSVSTSIGERSERATSSGSGSGDATVYQSGVGITAYELDFFGRLSSLNEAALQEYLATESAARTTRIALVAEIANAYFRMAANRSLLAIARDTVRASERSLELTRARLKGGVAPRSDVRQAQTVLAQAQSDLAELTTAVAQDENALRLLAGLEVDAAGPDSIESVIDGLNEVHAGLDSSLLLNRPDVQQAEHQLRAAHARIGAARAAFFPRISLTAAAGLASTSLSSLFTAGAFAWSAQPALIVPIFDAGANQANLDATIALREAAMARYQKTIQTAFREVADALARRGTIERQFDAQTRLVDAATDNLTLVEARYRQGIESFLGTLDAQRTLYAARRSLAQTRLVRAQNAVSLYRALGQPAR